MILVYYYSNCSARLFFGYYFVLPTTNSRAYHWELQDSTCCILGFHCCSVQKQRRMVNWTSNSIEGLTLYQPHHQWHTTSDTLQLWLHPLFCLPCSYYVSRFVLFSSSLFSISPLLSVSLSMSCSFFFFFFFAVYWCSFSSWIWLCMQTYRIYVLSSQ